MESPINHWTVELVTVTDAAAFAVRTRSNQKGVKGQKGVTLDTLLTLSTSLVTP